MDLGLELLRAPARQHNAIEVTEHRPWPLGGSAWLMGQSWDDLLFAHWRVEADALRRLVPAELELQEHDGSAWLGITPFVLTGLRLRGTLPLPVVSSFPELNVRTYVTAGGKPGIWFFSLDAASRGVVEAARRFYKLPYFHARMGVGCDAAGVEYTSARRDSARPFVFEARYRGTGRAFEPLPGTLEHFLVERYCLYAHDGSRLYRAEIHHPPWRIHAAEAELALNTMPPDGIHVSGEPLCHLASRQDVLIWPLASA
ncbi:MAG TPA: DUF2071 domain-containing protein [Gaiellaceae bacterium]|nr:DUF2071 domain-containing protein [Gaiellaceae bacterium]